MSKKPRDTPLKDKPKETPAFPYAMKIGGFAVSKMIPK